MPKKLLIPLGILLLVAAAVGGWLKFHDIFTEKPQTTGQVQPATTNQDDQPSSTNQTSGFDKTKYSLDDPTSKWMVVNKPRPLNPKNFVPASLVNPSVPLRVPGNESMQIRSDVAPAIKQLFDGAKTASFDLMFSSGYRSYNYQVSLYGGYVNSIGQAAADKQSARPGYSEHQTGLAFDLCNKADCQLEQAFGASDMGKWVAAHAYEYGFIIRYPEDKTEVTGYEYEPWHLRYVGTDLSTEMHNKNIETLEEFFGLPAAPDYL